MNFTVIGEYLNKSDHLNKPHYLNKSEYVGDLNTTSTANHSEIEEGYPNTLSLTITPELADAISYTQEVDEAYGLKNTDTTFDITTLPYGVGGTTDLETGKRFYTDTLPPGMNYKMIVEHEAFHKKQIQVAEDFGLSSEDLASIVPFLEGQAASVLDQNVYAKERELYECFMNLDAEKIPQGPYQNLRNYLNAVEEESKTIDLHPTKNTQGELEYVF